MSLLAHRFRPRLEMLEDRTAPATFTVINTDDSGAGSLRQALINANETKGIDTINFNIGGGGVQTIALASALPIMNTPVIIDGASQPGWAGTPLIVLDGSGAGIDAVGLWLAGGKSIVKGLAIHGFDGPGMRLSNKGGNVIRQNYIGMDETGDIAIGNGGDGLQVLSNKNVIGGTDPTLGNLISGNFGHGILITNGANQNFLAANFVGTDVTGVLARGNHGDGVAIVNANGNILAGTYVNLAPFVFKNVVSGNFGNGLRISNSNNTIVHANFFGLGADNQTGVPNEGSGTLVEGTSKNTIYGGIIPLGNVSAANLRHGLEIVDQASGVIAYNMFAGNAAFNAQVAVGNQMDGIHISSTGGRNTILTSVVSGNLDDGIEITGNARDVKLTQIIVGMNTDGQETLPNNGHGVNINENANNIQIGGFAPSIVPHNTISGNGLAGINIQGNAHDIHIFNSFIGTNTQGTQAFGNGLAGIAISEFAHDILIGGDRSRFRNLISGNALAGVLIQEAATRVRVSASLIGTDYRGQFPLPNGDSGIRIEDATGNIIGGSGRADGNTIAYNFGDGVTVQAGQRNSILRNSIHANIGFGIGLYAGANGGISAPDSFAAIGGPKGVTLTGTINGSANSSYVVQLFNSVGPDPGNLGQGMFYMGSVKVKTNSQGVGTFSFTGRPASAVQRFFSATVTDALGNTSEFCDSVEVEPFVIP